MTAEEQKINRIDFPNEIFSEKLGYRGTESELYFVL